MESRKRKPLSDLTNTYNLIPTSALRKLVAASANPNSFSKPPLSILKSNSTSTNQKFCSESSNKSSTSIGSSNVSATLNSKTVQFRNPAGAISSITSPGGRGSKDASYSRRQIIENSKKERKADVIVSCKPVEKRKDKAKAIVVPLSPSPTEKMKDNQNDICNPSTSRERQNQKGVANLSLSSGSVEIVKGSEKGILNSYGHSFEKTEKGKAILNSSGCALGKQTEIGKGIADNSCCSLEKTNDGKEGILKHSRSSIVKIKEIGKEFLNPSSFLDERAKDNWKPLYTYKSSHEKTREKGKAILQPSDIVEIAKHKGSSAALAVKSRPTRRKSEKRKSGAGASSCPPMMRTKNIQNDLDEAGDIKSSKSWTDPDPNCRKKRCSKIKNTSELPLDFVEQQRAYFKEVDEFELPEEDVSDDELD